MHTSFFCQPNTPCVCPCFGAVGPEVNPHMVSLLYPVERNLKAVAVALNKPLRWALALPSPSSGLPSDAACLPALFKVPLLLGWWGAQPIHAL